MRFCDTIRRGVEPWGDRCRGMVRGGWGAERWQEKQRRQESYTLKLVIGIGVENGVIE